MPWRRLVGSAPRRRLWQRRQGRRGGGSADPAAAAAATLAVVAALFWAVTGARAHQLAPRPAPRPLPPLPSPLPPPLDACPSSSSSSVSTAARQIRLPSSVVGGEAAAEQEAAAAVAAAQAATARVDALLDGGGMGRPTAASVLQFARARASGPRPVSSGVLFAAGALAALLVLLWRAVARLQVLFRACSAPPRVVYLGSNGAPATGDARAALASRAAAARRRATRAPLAAAARLFATAAAATAAAFGVLGAVGSAGSRLAPALFERADAAGAAIADAAARADDARSALLLASSAAGNLSLAIAGAGAAVAAAQAQAAGAGGSAAAAPSSFDGASAQRQLEQLRSGLAGAAAGLDPMLGAVRDRLLPVLLASEAEASSGALAGTERWWRLPPPSAQNWRRLAATLDDWRRRGVIGLFSALAAAPCLLSLLAWTGWRPGVTPALTLSLWLSALAALLALALALLNVALADACPAAEALALRYAPERLRPVLGYYLVGGGSGGGAGGGSNGDGPIVELDPSGAGLAVALEDSGVLGAGAPALLLRPLFGGGGGAAGGGGAIGDATTTATTALVAALDATLAALPPAVVASSTPNLADASAVLSDAGAHMAAAADAVQGELSALLAALSRDRVLGPLYAAPKALVCCAVPSLARAAWLALTGAGAGALAAGLLAVPLLRRLDLAAAAARVAGRGVGCCGGGGGGGGGAVAAVPMSGVGGCGVGGGGGGGGSDKARRAILEARLSELEGQQRMARLRALEDAAEAAAAARRAPLAGAPLM